MYRPPVTDGGNAFPARRSPGTIKAGRGYRRVAQRAPRAFGPGALCFEEAVAAFGAFYPPQNAGRFAASRPCKLRRTFQSFPRLVAGNAFARPAPRRWSGKHFIRSASRPEIPQDFRRAQRFPSHPKDAERILGAPNPSAFNSFPATCRRECVSMTSAYTGHGNISPSQRAARKFVRISGSRWTFLPR